MGGETRDVVRGDYAAEKDRDLRSCIREGMEKANENCPIGDTDCASLYFGDGLARCLIGEKLDDE